MTLKVDELHYDLNVPNDRDRLEKINTKSTDSLFQYAYEYENDNDRLSTVSLVPIQNISIHYQRVDQVNFDYYDKV